MVLMAMRRQADVVRAEDFIGALDLSCHLECFSLAKNVRDKKDKKALQVSFNLNFYTIMSYAMKSRF